MKPETLFSTPGGRPSGARTGAFIVAPLVAAMVIGMAAKTPGWTRADQRLAEIVHGLRTPWLTAVADVLRVGFLPVGVLAAGTVTAVLLLRAGRAGSALLSTLVVTTGWTASSLYKAVVARPRPDPAWQLVPEPGDDSFPSGHVAVTLALAVAWCLLTAGSGYFRPVLAVGAALVVAQGFARVYLGAHHPTDVIGSILVVGAVAMAVIAAGHPVAARLDRAWRSPPPDRS